MKTVTKAGYIGDEILRVKEKTDRKDLCLGLPPCFLEAFAYIDQIKPLKILDYQVIIEMFSSTANAPHGVLKNSTHRPSVPKDRKKVSFEKKLIPPQ